MSVERRVSEAELLGMDLREVFSETGDWTAVGEAALKGELARELAKALDEYPGAPRGYLAQETWELKRSVLLTRAREAGILD